MASPSKEGEAISNANLPEVNHFLDKLYLSS